MNTQRIKNLMELLPKNSGRDVFGHVSVRHQGGRHKRFYRIVDFKKDKLGIPAKVISIEYDPNRSADIALIQYKDGDKRFIIAPDKLHLGDTIMSGWTAEIRPGNTLALKDMPIGTPVHAIELSPGRPAQMVRSAGSVAIILARDGGKVQLKLPSGEVRLFDEECKGTVGQVGNIDWKNRVIGKAGRSRHMGIRPTVRGVAQNPRTHPHGGGEGRSGIGMPSPKSPWGKRTLGTKTRKKKKYSNKFILQKRK